MFDVHHHDAIYAILAHLHIFDLNRMARTDKFIADLCRHEIRRRIGHRNYQLLTVQSSVEPPPPSFNDLKYFAGVRCNHGPAEEHGEYCHPRNKVADPSTYLLLTIGLRCRYVPADLWNRETILNFCSIANLHEIMSYWIHIGLTNCARMIFDGNFDDWIWREHDRCKSSLAINSFYDPDGSPKIDINACNQEQLFWLAKVSYQSFSMRDYHSPALAKLDAKHFNLFIETTENATDKPIIRKSNADLPRYDPWFVCRIVETVRGGDDTPVNSIFQTHKLTGAMMKAPDYTPDILIRCNDCVVVKPHQHFAAKIKNPFTPLGECDCACHQCMCAGCHQQRVICQIPCNNCSCCHCRFGCICECICGAACKESCDCCKCLHDCVCG